jgi:hypothetical protein
MQARCFAKTLLLLVLVMNPLAGRMSASSLRLTGSPSKCFDGDPFLLIISIGDQT